MESIVQELIAITNCSLGFFVLGGWSYISFASTVPAKWLVRKTGFCTSQVTDGADRLRNDL